MALFSSIRKHALPEIGGMRPRHVRVWFARHALAAFGALLLACCATMAQAPARPQTTVASARRPAFRAVSYDVYASLSPADQTLAARATVEFESREASRVVE
jgi:hypothetical protein